MIKALLIYWVSNLNAFDINENQNANINVGKSKLNVKYKTKEVRDVHLP